MDEKIQKEVKEIDIKTNLKPKKTDMLGQYLITGGPGRGKGTLNKFTQQRNQFYKACQDGKLFQWVQEALSTGNSHLKLDILRVWASLQPREVRSEFDRMPVIINIIRSDGTVHTVSGNVFENQEKETINNVIDVDEKKEEL